jgi:2-succinyl-5-enolpyruvyl-6-hydroxy-3-cyclohexene-1-carboxylate synthase
VVAGFGAVVCSASGVQLDASSMPADITATFCAILVDEWVRAGVTIACVAPGSRSTPMALALVGDDRIRVEIFHDERSASFAALGVATSSKKPAVLLCTSGTAAAHFYAAIIEAHLSSIPMIVCTADRPVELWDVGAAQTVNQTNLYGSSVRWFFEPGVAEYATVETWRSLGARAAAEANGYSGRPGPVHLNLSFREPLVGTPHELPTGRNHHAPWHSAVSAMSSAHTALNDALTAAWSGKRGVFVVGEGDHDANLVLDVADLLGWPVLADHRSRCRLAGRSIRHNDALLRVASFADAQRVEVVVRIGEGLSSKVTNQWLTACVHGGAVLHVITSAGRWIDPDHLAGAMIVGPEVLTGVRDVLAGRPRPEERFSTAWEAADVEAATAIASTLAGYPMLSEPLVARTTIAAAPAGSTVVVSSSMPVRDVEWYADIRSDVRVLSNRGANGIDGVVATAIGAALSTNAPTICLIGDVALLHDSSSLAALAHRDVDLCIVVTDNDGGAIFSFLPQATDLPNSTYEQLFGTPHGTDLAVLMRAHGLHVRLVETVADLTEVIATGTGPRVVIVKTDRETNVDVHRALNLAVAKRLSHA